MADLKDRPGMSLEIFAYHSTQIFNQEADGKLRRYHPCDGVIAEVVVKPAAGCFEGMWIWDAVYINGVSCGNRHGGLKTFVEMVNSVEPWLAQGHDPHHTAPLKPNPVEVQKI